MADFNSIGEMMQDCAAGAVAEAHDRFGFTLDYSPQSLQSLETILANVSTTLDVENKDAVEQVVKIWGSYFGETVRRNCGGSWDLIQYPGRVSALPALIVAGSHLYPLMKVFRRLTMGEPENIWKFYERIQARLAAAQPAQESSRPN